MSDTPDDGGPPLLRPIPRRPFNLNIREPTPPDGENNDDGQQSSNIESESASASPLGGDLRGNNNSNRSQPPPMLNLETLNSRLLNSNRNSSRSRNNAIATPSSEGVFPGSGGNNPPSSSISRAQSILNLTGSTLMGIYTPNTYGPDRASLLTDGGSGTPWGTGAETPARLDDDKINDADMGFSGEDGDDDDDDDDEYDDDETEGEREMRRRRRSSMHAAEIMRGRRASLLHQAWPPLPPQQEYQQHEHPLLHLPPAPSPYSVSSTLSLVLRLAPRALLLSALGVLYGILVARVLDRFRPAATTIVSSTNTQYYGWKYMTFWGVSGVVLGGLLPWFDGVWEGTTVFGHRSNQHQQRDAEAESTIAVKGGRLRQQRQQHRRRSTLKANNKIGDGNLSSGVGVDADGAVHRSPLSTLPGKGLGQGQGDGGTVEEAANPGPDWSLAVRGIGTFVGIAFAIRRLAWDSTLQVSVTLAMVNPFLWYLIDRSIPGLLMAGAVGICGSALFMVPLAASSSSLAAFSPWAYLLDPNVNSAASDGDWNAQQEGFNASSSYSSPPLPLLHNGGLAGAGAGAGDAIGTGSSGHALETAVWMLSVLFCCCVCFGNIGRWLALMSKNSSAGSHNRARSGSISTGFS